MAPNDTQLTIVELKSKVDAFEQQLATLKKSREPKVNSWYPYGSLNNFHVLRGLLGDDFRFGNLIRDGRVLDIGAADGDTAFFMESLGFKVSIVDHAPTNYNHLDGARTLKELLNSEAEIHDIDLDSQFKLPMDQVDFAFFLGILYHLKNPFYALEQLAKKAKHCLLSTRIARFTPDGRQSLKDYPLAYLVHASESNNDATNFWIFSEGGLKRILNRAGWHVERFISLGDTQKSNPADNHHDERAFCLLRSGHLT